MSATFPPQSARARYRRPEARAKRAPKGDGAVDGTSTFGWERSRQGTRRSAGGSSLAGGAQDDRFDRTIGAGRSLARHPERSGTSFRRTDIERLPGRETFDLAGVGRRRLAIGRAVAGRRADFVNFDHPGTRQPHHGVSGILHRLLGGGGGVLGGCVLLLVEIIELRLLILHLGAEVGDGFIPPL